MGDGWSDLARAALERLDPEEAGVWRLKLTPLAQLSVVGVGLLLLLEAERINNAFWWLNGSNLLIHEAGHPIFSLVFLGSRFMMFVGGTAFQLLVPLAFYASFLSRGQVRSADVALLWFGQNFLNIAPYAADARAMDLPLVGGGEHDWNYLLGCFHLLEHDRQVGQFFNLTGCLVISFALYALVVHWKRPRRGSPLENALWGQDQL